MLRYPMSTGEAARLLDTDEPRLSHLIRRGRITPPPLSAGRRLWERGHLLQAAVLLGRVALVTALEREEEPRG